MAPLPDMRVPGALQSEVVPFQYIALDAAGPFTVAQGEGRGSKHRKRWFIVFRDLLYGGIYLEVLTHMDIVAFLNTLSRLCFERTVPKHIVCDNGTNFVGGANELNSMWDEIDKNEIRRRRPDITWDFVPPSTPHMNGAAERMVQSAKLALTKALPKEDSLLTEDTFHTYLKFAQRVINDRPIAYTETDANDFESLTPNHFMLAGNIASDLLPVDEGLSLDDRINYLIFLKNEFWKRFVEMATPELRAYNKWLTRRDEIQVGDVVVILDELSYKEHHRYPLGKIQEIIGSRTDKVPRKAKIKTLKGEKLVALNRLYVVLPAKNLRTVDIHCNNDDELHEQKSDSEEEAAARTVSPPKRVRFGASAGTRSHAKNTS